MFEPSVASGVATALAYAFLRAGHALGDHPVQSDWAALHKAQPDDEQLAAGAPAWRGWDACLHHVATYGIAQAIGLLIAWVISPLTVAGAVAALAISLSTHAVIDRRWIVRAIIRIRHKENWPDGPYLIDQSLHHGCIAIAAAAAGLVTAAGTFAAAAISTAAITAASAMLVAAGLLIEKRRASRLAAAAATDHGPRPAARPAAAIGSERTTS